MVKAEGLGRKFGGRWIFRSLDLDLKAGQCLCVMGSNGSGKSTLLKILAGLLSPSEGSVSRPERNQVGYASLDLSLYPQLTAEEHLQLFAQFRGLPPPPTAILPDVGLQDIDGKLVGAFSTGMRARLKLALATFYSPKVLLLDEPTAALDEQGQTVIAVTVQRQLQHGVLVLATNSEYDHKFATHELKLGT